MTSWLDDEKGKTLLVNTETIPNRKELDIVGAGVSSVDSNGRTTLTIEGGLVNGEISGDNDPDTVVKVNTAEPTRDTALANAATLTHVVTIPEDHTLRVQVLISLGVFGALVPASYYFDAANNGGSASVLYEAEAGNPLAGLALSLSLVTVDETVEVQITNGTGGEIALGITHSYMSESSAWLTP